MTKNVLITMFFVDLRHTIITEIFSCGEAAGSLEEAVLLLLAVWGVAGCLLACNDVVWLESSASHIMSIRGNRNILPP